MDETTVKLAEIFRVVTDWLKFAEAKNAVLLAFSGAGITATLTYLSAATNLSKSIQTGFLATTFLLCLTSLVCSISFLPKTNLEYIVWLQGKPARKLRNLQEDSDNLYYFGHLLKYSSVELLDSMNRLYFESRIQSPYKKEYLDLASQIVINAEIASIKFRLFIISLWLLIISICTIPVVLALSLIIYRHL